MERGLERVRMRETRWQRYVWIVGRWRPCVHMHVREIVFVTELSEMRWRERERYSERVCVRHLGRECEHVRERKADGYVVCARMREMEI